MKIIFFNQRALILCREGEQAEKDPEAVIVIDHGCDTVLEDAVSTMDSGSGISRLYILCDNPESTYDRLRKLFTEVDAAGGLVGNDRGQYLLIFRNGRSVGLAQRKTGERREHSRECSKGGNGGMRNPCP